MPSATFATRRFCIASIARTSAENVLPALPPVPVTGRAQVRVMSEQ